MEAKIPLAFVAGLVSFVTPCVLPLVPGYLSAVSGVQIGVGGRRVVAASIPFIAGFTLVFVALGALAGAAPGPSSAAPSACARRPASALSSHQSSPSPATPPPRHRARCSSSSTRQG